MTMALRFSRIPLSIYHESYYSNNPLRLYVTSNREKTNEACSTQKVPPKPPAPVWSDSKDDREVSKSPTDSSDSTSKNSIKSKLSPKAVRDNVRGYVFTRYFDYVKNYDKVLEKNFPSAVKVYRVFFDGVKEFFGDMKRFLKISRIVSSSPEGIKALNRQELELYTQMPRDMIKVAPALIGSSLPVIGYAVFPLVFMYPRKLLTSHFWTLHQRAEFKQLEMRERLSYNRPVFRCLQAKLKDVNTHPQYENLGNILGQLGSGFHPTVESLINVKDIFATEAYSLLYLSGKHIRLLNQMHGLGRGWFKRNRLYEHAFMVHYMDEAINREGGVHNMPSEAMRNACYIRGLNPTNLSNDEMIEWLRRWIEVSISVKEEHISLFLHLPLFLAYNHPNNWHLIYASKKKNCP